ncbi:MAG: hypothetical protein NZ551_09365 [Microscillaceae bacterium]|nr:hypothetical protein [Microscillaceae bacterium]MDW8461409.1 hypothetical protein [Cytophagales bacterium]
MLTDYWVITQFLALLFSWGLLLNASFFSLTLIQKWQITQSNETQLDLERKSYLIGAILQFVLLFQFLTFLLFLNTVNIHLPKAIKGAMCATGVIELNAWGYPTLWLKLTALFVYAIFLIFNYLDNQEPAYPLTPKKYFFVFPAFLLLTLDLFFSYQFFSKIEPDIIATCCSVKFVTSTSQSYFQLTASPQYPYFALGVWLFLGILLGFLSIFNYLHLVKLLFSIVFIFFSVYVLKHFFVKYIYGLPSHNCLFDIFWAKYHYIGYVLFGLYAFVLLNSLFQWLIAILQNNLQTDYQKLAQKARFIQAIAFLLILLIPAMYWFTWKGNL